MEFRKAELRIQKNRIPQNSESRTDSEKLNSAWNSESRIQEAEFRKQNSEKLNSEFRKQNSESRIQKSRIQKAESRIEKAEFRKVEFRKQNSEKQNLEKH